MELQTIPRYKVLVVSLIGNDIKQPGDIVPYDGLPAENLEPTCDVGRARYAEYLESNKRRIAVMTEHHGSESAVGDPTKFLAALMAQQRADAEQQAAVMSQTIAQTVAEAMAQAMAKFFPVGLGLPVVPVDIREPAPAPAVDPTPAPAPEAAATELQKRTKAA